MVSAYADNWLYSAGNVLPVGHRPLIKNPKSLLTFDYIHRHKLSR